MSDRQIRGVERAIADADARGEFSNLPGAGKPLPGIDKPLADDWWLRQQTTRENIGEDALPPALRLRKEVERLPQTLDRLSDEAAVTDAIADLNQRIRDALLFPGDGPPLRFGPVDHDQTLAAWRQRRDG